MARETMAPLNALSRRDFMKKAAIGLAAVVGLGASLRTKAGKGPFGARSTALPEDSIFAPRPDQRARVIGD